jgi:peptidoglycan/LPS O-acetylase OafA/YrhL
MMQPSGSFKNQDIQVLRGIAIILVMMQHWRNRLPTPESYAQLFQHVVFWPGVDIFLAISGFLIYRSISGELNRASSITEAMRRFWLRRAARLVPAVVFWSLLSIGVASVTKTVWGTAIGKVAFGALLGAFGVSNFYLAYCVPEHLAACGNPDYNGVTWSLSLEWQLYALLATALCFARKRRAVMLFVGVACILLLFSGTSFPALFYFRPQAFALGVLIAFLIESGSRYVVLARGSAANIVLLVLGILTAIAAPIHFPDQLQFAGIAVASALCLLSAIHGDSYSRTVLSLLLRWIGERSYSIYLCHLPIFLLVREGLSASFGLGATATTLCIALFSTTIAIALASQFSYRFVEQPLQKRFKREGGEHASIRLVQAR